MPVEREAGGEIRYRPVSLTTLVDSPAILGEHLASVDLAERRRPPPRASTSSPTAPPR